MKLAIKQIGFLFLMAVLGLMAVIVFEEGYPLGWRIGGEGWVVSWLVLDLLVIAGALAAVFFLMRGFLFGRGRPWLAIVSIAGWLGVFALLVPALIGGRQALATSTVALGNKRLSSHYAELLAQPWSDAEVAALPAPERLQACGLVFAEEKGSYSARRASLPVQVTLPEREAERQRLLASDACPAEVKTAVAELARLKAEREAALEQYEAPGKDAAELSRNFHRMKVLSMAAAQLAVLAHPDAAPAMMKLVAERREKPIESVLGSERLQLRLARNGQVKDHEWTPLPGFESPEGRGYSVDLAVWPEAGEGGSQRRSYWHRVPKEKDHWMLVLRQADCSRLTKTKVQAFIQIQGEKTVFEANFDPFGEQKDTVAPGQLVHTMNTLACSAQARLVKMPEEASAGDGKARTGS